MGAKNDRSTAVEQASEREFVITRVFNAPVRLVFEAWTKPALFMQWWAPRSMGMTMAACDMDVRTGGGYRVAFSQDPSMAFYGKYLEVVPNARLVWTNEEDADGAVTTVTFEDRGDTTLVVLRELYPSKEALEAASGAESALPEQFAQLDELLDGMGARVR